MLNAFLIYIIDLFKKKSRNFLTVSKVGQVGDQVQITLKFPFLFSSKSICLVAKNSHNFPHRQFSIG